MHLCLPMLVFCLKNNKFNKCFDFRNSSLSSKETERERLDILRQILPENYKYMVDEFYIKKRSQKVAGETTFNTTFRVNITDKDDIQIFISKLGEKSVTAYN